MLSDIVIDERSVSNFILYMWNSVRDPATNDVIRWSKDGKAIEFPHRSFCGPRGGDFESVLKSLRNYGFVCRYDDFPTAYSHHLFTKNGQHLSEITSDRSGKSRKRKNPSNPIGKDRLSKIRRANPNFEDKHDIDPLCYALFEASTKGHLEITKILLDAGVDVNLQNKHGWTVLMKASLKGHTEIARMLLEARADPDKRNLKGATALVYASSRNYIDIVRLLLDNDVESESYSDFSEES